MVAQGRRVRRYSAAAAVLVALVSALLAAGETPPAARSVWDGVFSPEQVERGRENYLALCARCHGETLGGGETSPPLVDRLFLEKWYGKSVGELVELTRKTMPTDAPGVVNRRQSTDIAAFLLRENDFPAGERALEPELAALNRILITPPR